jgi:hypothetical protein
MMKAALLALPSVRVLASEEDDEAVLNSSSDCSSGGPDDVGSTGFAVVFDPLDGSRNIEVSIPTGTIFGVYSCSAGTAPCAVCLMHWLMLAQQSSTLSCAHVLRSVSCSCCCYPASYSMVSEHYLVLPSACCSTRSSLSIRF